MRENGKSAVLIMNDGSVIHGRGFGHSCARAGELVFNTAMQGYQEGLTDPSYAGQLLVSTYPLAGNYGINDYSFESDKIQAEGYIVRELCEFPEHMDSKKSLDEFLKEYERPGIEGVDTRSLVLKLRNRGVMPAILAVSDKPLNVKELLENLKYDYSNIDFISNLTVKKPEEYGTGKKRIVLIDYGVKRSIINELVALGLKGIVVPAHESAETIKSFEPEGIVLSSGPGNPAILDYAHETIRKLAGYDYPMFGICLGNQLIAHAFGGDTYKLKFGHRGVNHPVIDLEDKRVRITTQNHGFAVGKAPKGFEISHKSANDGSVEGLRREDGRIFSVQYHPESTPGPHDSRMLFNRFVKMLG